MRAEFTKKQRISLQGEQDINVVILSVQLLLLDLVKMKKKHQILERHHIFIVPLKMVPEVNVG
ncbi:hypothetical protein NX82_12910 [Proteus mirabilis]|nr:hypothetical protein NX82_12910 [Proteus mirabilis]